MIIWYNTMDPCWNPAVEIQVIFIMQCNTA
jgi:hypothetical protein